MPHLLPEAIEEAKRQLQQDEPKKFSAAWFKEQFVIALINLAAVGFVGLIGYALIIAYVGDSKWDKKFDEFKLQVRAEMIDRHNETVKRESDLVKNVQELQDQVKKLPTLPPIPNLPIGGGSPNVPNLPNVPNIPQNAPNVQQSPDRAKWEYLEKNQEKLQQMRKD